VLDRLALIDLGKGAGFTIAELKRLLAGFTRRTPPGARWRSLTRTELAELDARIAEAERMKRVLRRVGRCRCPTLEDCGRALREGRGSGPADGPCARAVAQIRPSSLRPIQRR